MRPSLSIDLRFWKIRKQFIKKCIYLLMQNVLFFLVFKSRKVSQFKLFFLTT